MLDWRVPAGQVNGSASFDTFRTILNNATSMDTGFIVLQHDLYEASVDLAVGYTLPYAIDFDPKLTFEPIGQCVKKPTADMYLESNTNTTFPRTRDVDTDGDGEVDVKSGDGGSTGGTSPAIALDVSSASFASLFSAASLGESALGVESSECACASAVRRDVRVFRGLDDDDRMATDEPADYLSVGVPQR